MNAQRPPPAALPPARTVPCPRCGGPSRYAPDNPYRPFCSPRCKLAELGAWANEEFRVDVSEDPPAPPEDGALH
jgi:endogenous inhibitor of DNA gyrase (YacG/DUF329 family)